MRWPPLEHLLFRGSVFGFCHICSSFFVLFWANRKVQLGGVANCFDFCAICYLHLNLQIFCGQADRTTHGDRDIRKIFILFRAHFVFGWVCLTQNEAGFWQMHKSCSEGPWPSCQYLHNVRLSFIFFYFFTVAPLTSPPAGRPCISYQLFWRLPEFDCLPLFAWNKMLWLMAWL